MPFLLIAAAVIGYILLSNSSPYRGSAANSQPVFNLIAGKSYLLIVATTPGASASDVTNDLKAYAQGSALSGAIAVGSVTSGPQGSGVLNGQTVDEWYVPIVAMRNLMVGDLQTVVGSAPSQITQGIIGAMAG